ncbi:unnamed protein product [Closterium sp. Yama58-4]|nr:unnamed protein product [Closterium sp. Yama58-4]
MHLARVLSATCRNAVKQRGTVAVGPSLPAALQQQQRRHQSGQQSEQPSAQQSGLADFFEQGRTPDAPVTTGRGWQAWELRHKSFEDLHALWYVLLKEKNLLYSQKQMLQSQGRRMVQPHRIRLVKASMCRIKQVLTERALAVEDPDKRCRSYGFHQSDRVSPRIPRLCWLTGRVLPFLTPLFPPLSASASERSHDESTQRNQRVSDPENSPGTGCHLVIVAFPSRTEPPRRLLFPRAPRASLLRRSLVTPALPFHCSSSASFPIPLVCARGERVMAAQRAPPSFRLRAYYGIDFPGKVAVLVAQSLLSFALAATLFGRYAAAVALVRRFWPLLPAQVRCSTVWYGLRHCTAGKVAVLVVQSLLSFALAAVLFGRYAAAVALVRRFWPLLPAQVRTHALIASFLVEFSAALALLLTFAYSLTLSANLRTSLLLRPRLARHMLSLVPAWQPVRTALDLGSGRGVLLASLGLQLLECGGEGRAIGFDSWETNSRATGGAAGVNSSSRLEVERSRSLKGAAAGAADAGDGANGVAAGGADGANADAGASGSSSSSGKNMRHRRADKAKAGHPGRNSAGAAPSASAAPASGLAAVSAPAVGSMAGALRAAAREGVGALVTCKTGAFDRLPFPDAYFDVVVSALRLHAIASVLEDTDPQAAEKERQRVLQQVARVLKPGGRVIVWDVMHVPAYAEYFRSLGWKHVVVTPGPNAFMLPSHVLSARKPK